MQICPSLALFKNAAQTAKATEKWKTTESVEDLIRRPYFYFSLGSKDI